MKSPTPSLLLLHILLAGLGYFCSKYVLSMSLLKWTSWAQFMLATKTFVPLADMYKRGLFDNFITDQECSDIMELMKHGMVDATVGDKLQGKTAYELWADVKKDPSNGNLTRQWDLYWNIGDRIRNLVHDYFELDEVYIDFTHLTARSRGEAQFSHGPHADNCRYDQVTKTCTKRDDACCAWREWTALLYLNGDFEGGEFFFANDDMVPVIDVKPKCGRMVFLSSGAENIHGVYRISQGMRYAYAVWLTPDASRRQADRLVVENSGRK